MIAILQWQKAIALESFIVANFEVALIKNPGNIPCLAVPYV